MASLTSTQPISGAEPLPAAPGPEAIRARQAVVQERVRQALREFSEEHITLLQARARPEIMPLDSRLTPAQQKEFSDSLRTREQGLRWEPPIDRIKVLLNDPDEGGAYRFQVGVNLLDQYRWLLNAQDSRPGDCGVITEKRLKDAERAALLVTETPFRRGDDLGHSSPLDMVTAFDRCHVKNAPVATMPDVAAIQAQGKRTGDIRLGAVNALLQVNRGVFFGDSHIQEEVPRFLAQHMAALKEAGVEVLFVEAPSDATAWTYGSGDELLRHPEKKLEEVLKLSVEERRDLMQQKFATDKLDPRREEYQLRMFLAAQKAGIELVNIDPDGVRRDVEDSAERLARTNYTWKDVMDRTLAKYSENAKYLVFGGIRHSRYPANSAGRSAQGQGIPTVNFLQFTGAENADKELAMDLKNKLLVFNTDSHNYSLDDEGNVTNHAGEIKLSGRLDDAVYVSKSVPGPRVVPTSAIARAVMPVVEPVVKPVVKPVAASQAGTIEVDAPGHGAQTGAGAEFVQAADLPASGFAEAVPAPESAAQNKLEDEDRGRLAAIIKSDILADLKTYLAVVCADEQLQQKCAGATPVAGAQFEALVQAGDRLWPALGAVGYEQLVQNILKTPADVNLDLDRLHLPDEMLASATRRVLRDFDVADFIAEIRRRSHWLDDPQFRNTHPTWDDAWAEMSKEAMVASWQGQKAEKPAYGLALSLVKKLAGAGGENLIPLILDAAP